jgi:uncharacterized cupredoxin-like copper-binding protein
MRPALAAPLAVGLLLVGLAGGCTDDDAVATVPGVRVVEVVMTEMAFEPSSFTFRAGETVEFRFENRGRERHEAVIGDEAAQRAAVAAMEEMDRKAGGPGRARRGRAHPGMGLPNVISLEPGEQGSITFLFSKAGRLLMQCHEPGHLEGGMTATITITP